MKVRISRWRGLLKTFRWKRLTIEWKVRAQNVLLDFKEYVVGFVQTDRAESHRMPREESAVQMQIRSLGVLYPCRREYGKKCEKCSAEKEWDKRRRSIK